MEKKVDWSDKFKTIEAYLEYKHVLYNKNENIINNQDGEEIYGDNQNKRNNSIRE